MYLVDSCTIISAFRPKESSFQESRDLLFGLPQFFITDYVLAEVVTILKFKVGLAAAQKALELLLYNKAVDLLKLTTEELADTVDLFSLHKKLSFVDASLIVMAKSRGLALISQDNALSKAFKHGGRPLGSAKSAA